MNGRSVCFFIALALLPALITLLAGCLGTQNPAPISTYGGSAGVGGKGVHVVDKGDTLYSISQRYKIVMQDIVFENDLTSPFILQPGERIDLPPPRQYKVREGDTLYAISRIYDTSPSQLARLNNLSPPYTLEPGQTLNLPSKTRQTQLASAARPAVQRDPVQETVMPAQKPGEVERASLSRPAPEAVRTQPPRREGRFLRPVDGPVISSYGPKKGGLHNDGINIRAPKGTPVKAAENGVVVYAGNELRGSGNLILIRHEGRYMSAYAHLDRISIERGAKVSRGDVIGTVGATGSVSEPQLHFEIRKGTAAKDPGTYI